MGSDLSLEELSVTIKTIKVNSRKMTLAVFKQLPEENIFHPKTLELKGIPWGKVNYYWGDQKPWQGIQVVWTKDGILKRCFLKKYGEYKDYLKNRCSNPEVEYDQIYKLRDLPFGVLTDVIKNARTGGIEEEAKAKEIFSKYKEVYSRLNEMDQLYIST